MTGKLSKNFHGVGIGPLSKMYAVKYFLMQFMFVYFHKNGLDAIKTAMHQAKVVKWTF